MLVLNPALTVISLLTAFLMLFVTARFTKFSAKYYIKQQHDLGAVDGYIEEMMDGQKVVKVFCHEEEAKAGFRRVNEELRDSGCKANTYANLLMPVNANIGWLSYAVVAIVGAILAINGLAGVTVGTVVTLRRPQQELHPADKPALHADKLRRHRRSRRAARLRPHGQEPEKDDGYVELVNAR